MTISTVQVVDDNVKTITSAKGIGGEVQQEFVAVSSLKNATSEPVISIARVEWESQGTGNVTLMFNETEALVLNGNGTYGLKPDEPRLKFDGTDIADIKLNSDTTITKYNVVLETQKETGFGV
jgi:hypothetical protein